MALPRTLGLPRGGELHVRGLRPRTATPDFAPHAARFRGLAWTARDVHVAVERHGRDRRTVRLPGGRVCRRRRNVGPGVPLRLDDLDNVDDLHGSRAGVLVVAGRGPGRGRHFPRVVGATDVLRVRALGFVPVLVHVGRREVRLRSRPVRAWQAGPQDQDRLQPSHTGRRVRAAARAGGRRRNDRLAVGRGALRDRLPGRADSVLDRRSRRP